MNIEEAVKELTEIKELVEEDLKYKDYNVTAVLDQIDLESLVIVLNELEKKDEEIRLDNNIINRRNEDNLELAIRNVKLNKVIDLIVNTIVGDRRILKLVCNKIINKKEDECFKQNKLCNDCIKEYFYNKIGG